MNIFDFYTDKTKHDELAELLTIASQRHKYGLAANFLEKDIWVTEILRLLYDENLLSGCSVAFKGGTALSKCWGVIERFSEDIDLSIHWADLSSLLPENEQAAWEKSIQSKNQNKKFRDEQQKRLITWSNKLVKALNVRLSKYQIEGLYASLDQESSGEKIEVYFPRVVKGNNNYQLDYILLEFGGRNRGKPTKTIEINCYLNDIEGFEFLSLPKAQVNAYQKDFILWEKLTALHQFCTQEKEPNPDRLARHWYDVDCLIKMKFADPLNSHYAMQAVIQMKKHRWPSAGVNYEQILKGKITLIPGSQRLQQIESDHNNAILAGMFFSSTEPFKNIIHRLAIAEKTMNQHFNKIM